MKKGKGLLIMIAPSRKQRADLGPAGYKDSMRPTDGMDDDMAGPLGSGGDEGGSYEVTIPAHCLSDDASSINPGDSIDFDASGKVTDVSNGKVTISIKTVNGEACDGSGDDGDEGEEDDGTGTDGGMGGNTGESTQAMGDRLRKRAASIQ